jgi:HD-GYP domain-containing protein (c-di-GMP phosphodiesterase class II)
MEEAIAEIIRCRGTQFDPDVVDAVVRGVENGNFTMIPRSSTSISAPTYVIPQPA